MFYIKLITELQRMDGAVLRDFYRYSGLIVAVLLLNVILNYLLVCIKMCIFSQLHPYTCSELESRSSISWLKTKQMLFRTCLNTTVIGAYVRLMLRLAWIFFFLDLLTPYYYLCIAEMCWVCYEPYIKLEILENFLTKITKKPAETANNVPERM